MEQIVNDKTFGQMIYKHSWVKQETVNWWGNSPIQINIKAHAYKDQPILDSQREGYSNYLKRIDSIVLEAMPKIISYINGLTKYSVTEEDIFRNLIPKTVIFMRNSEWGILFDNVWDEEGGVAVYTENRILNVGIQNEFL